MYTCVHNAFCISPSGLRCAGMGSGCHSYPPDWPKAWFPARGPCECEGGKASPLPRHSQTSWGGTQPHSRERRKIWGRKNREWVTHVHLHYFRLVEKLECIAKLLVTFLISEELWNTYYKIVLALLNDSPLKHVHLCLISTFPTCFSKTYKTGSSFRWVFEHFTY